MIEIVSGDMILYVLALLAVAAGSACNAVMDIISHNLAKSIFKDKDPQWWDPKISWKNKYVDWDFGDTRRNGFVQLSDAWHFFKTLMILCIMLAATLLFLIHPDPIMLFNIKWLDWLLELGIHWLILGTVWNVTFTKFYHKILRIN